MIKEKVKTIYRILFISEVSGYRKCFPVFLNHGLKTENQMNIKS
jgi:hypothetical protein